MCKRYYFAAYSGGECILKCQGTNMTVNTLYNKDAHMYFNASYITVVRYIDDDGKPQKVTLSPYAVWVLEEYDERPQPKIISSNAMLR